MKSFTLIFILLVGFAAVTLVAPEPEPAKASRFRAAEVIEDDVKANDEPNDQTQQVQVVENDATKKVEPAKGRLFMRKFLLFKKMFNQNQQQPIIPIIITGNNPTGTVTTPITPTTTTVTSGTLTPSSPSTPGTVTDTASPTGTTPTSAPTSPTSPSSPSVPSAPTTNANTPRMTEEPESENEAVEVKEQVAADEQTLAAALAAGAHEYIVTDQEIRGTSAAKAINGPSRVNLKRRGNKQDQVISVRVPAKYSGYFRKGQRVYLNTKNNKKRPVKRRVVRRRNNRRRPNKGNKKNKNKKKNKNNRRRRIPVA